MSVAIELGRGQEPPVCILGETLRVPFGEPPPRIAVGGIGGVRVPPHLDVDHPRDRVSCSACNTLSTRFSSFCQGTLTHPRRNRFFISWRIVGPGSGRFRKLGERQYLELVVDPSQRVAAEGHELAGETLGELGGNQHWSIKKLA